jgi:hypothetical protein
MKTLAPAFQTTFKNPIIHFLFFWGINTLVYVTAIGGLNDILPPRLDWIQNILFPFCVIGGFITSFIAYRKINGIITSKKAVITTLTTGMVGLLALTSLYAASFAFTPKIYVTAEQLANARLTPNQIVQIQEILTAQGYISFDNLSNINLTVDQQLAVKKVLDGLGYTTVGDVEKISKNIVTTQAGNGETKAGKKGFPAKASRKATNTFCLFFRAVEM